MQTEEIKNILESSLVNYSWTAINLDALNKMPERQSIMQLCFMLNDLDSISYLNRLLAQKEREHEQYNGGDFFPTKWLEGVRLFLLRQNILILFEGFKTIGRLTNQVETYMPASAVKNIKKRPPGLAQLIKEDEKLSRLLKKLNSYGLNFRTQSEVQFPLLSVLKISFAWIYDGKRNKRSLDGLVKKELETIVATDVGSESTLSKSMAFVRNKLSAHADADVLKSGLKDLTNRGIDEGFLVAPKAMEDIQLSSFRAFFLDAIISQVWQGAVKNALKNKYEILPDDKFEIWKRYAAKIDSLKRVMSELVFSLLEAYVKAHELEVSTERLKALGEAIKSYNEKPEPPLG